LLGDHERDMRFGLPEPVLSIPPEELDRRMRRASDDLLEVRGVGAFVRILVPVSLTAGHQIVFGAWLGVPRELLRRASDVWWGEGYPTLRLDGLLANRLPPWEDETYGAALTALVRDEGQLPYAVASPDPVMQDILTRDWPHELVLAALAAYSGYSSPEP
jgi:hypothetical protein